MTKDEIKTKDKSKKTKGRQKIKKRKRIKVKTIRQSSDYTSSDMEIGFKKLFYLFYTLTIL